MFISPPIITRVLESWNWK